MPPPKPISTPSPEYTPASLNPASTVLCPNVSLYENSSPGFTIVPFNFSAANTKLLFLLTLLESKFVVNVASKFTNISSPKVSTVFEGFVIFNGIVYSSFSSLSMFSISSSEIANSIPSFSL